VPDVSSGRLALPIPLDDDPSYLLPSTIRDMVDQLELQVPAPPLGFLWTLTGASSNPSLGNALSRGIYWRLGEDLVRALWYVKFGSTSTYGGGLWRLSLPFPALQPVIGAGAVALPYWAEGVATDTGTADYRIGGNVDRADNTKLALKAGPSVAGGPVVNLNPTTPFTFGNGDELLVTLTYQTDE
jgi:hypothetical protein